MKFAKIFFFPKSIWKNIPLGFYTEISDLTLGQAKKWPGIWDFTCKSIAAVFSLKKTAIKNKSPATSKLANLTKTVYNI